jgi:hypothetical protein
MIKQDQIEGRLLRYPFYLGQNNNNWFQMILVHGKGYSSFYLLSHYHTKYVFLSIMFANQSLKVYDFQDMRERDS